MSWLRKILGTKKKKETNQSFKSTGLPDDWHNELLTEQVFNYLFKEQDYLTDKNLIKKNIGPLWNDSNLSYKEKLKMLYDFVENTYGTVKEKEGKMMSKTAIALRQAYDAKKNNVGGLINDFTRFDQYKIKPLHDDVEDFFNTIARIYQGGVYGSKLGSVVPKSKGKAPEYVNPKSLKPPWKNEFPHRKPSRFNENASKDAVKSYNLDYRLPLPKKGTLPPPTKTRSKYKKAPPRKSSVAKKLSDQLGFDNIQKEFQPDPNAQQGFLNTNKLPPITPPNKPLNEKDNDWDTFFRKFSDDYKKRYGDITPMTEKDLIEFLRREGLTDKEIENMKINHPDFFNLVLKKGDDSTKQAYVDGYKSKFIDNPMFGGRKRRKRKSRKRKSNKRKKRKTRRKYKKKTRKRKNKRRRRKSRKRYKK
tara:strand:+ start:22972 stop:24225 length:1254 start_codon:yes stop_codon:yes gene_type:complete